MKFTSPLGGIQQVGAPETAAKSVTPCFYLRLVTYKRVESDTSLNFIITNSNTEPKSQVMVSHDVNSPAFTP